MCFDTLLLAGGGPPSAQPRQLTGALLTQQHVAARVTRAAGTRDTWPAQLTRSWCPVAGGATGAEGGGDSAIICAAHCLRNLLPQHPRCLY